MILRVFFGAVLAAAVMFGWGFVYWTMLPFSMTALKKLPNEDAVIASLQENISQTGLYQIPGMDESGGGEAAAVREEWETKYRRGPVGWLVFQKEGAEPMEPRILIQGFVDMLVSAIVAGGLLSLAAPSLGTYGRRVLFVAGLGVFAVLAVVFSDAIWWRMPWDFQLLKAAYDVVGWTLAGVVLAAFVKT